MSLQTRRPGGRPIRWSPFFAQFLQKSNPLQSLRHSKPCHLPLHKGGSHKHFIFHTSHFKCCVLDEQILMQMFHLEGEAVQAYGECPDKRSICAKYATTKFFVFRLQNNYPTCLTFCTYRNSPQIVPVRIKYYLYVNVEFLPLLYICQ